jgi:hypothetical protein
MVEALAAWVTVGRRRTVMTGASEVTMVMEPKDGW